MSSSLFRPLDNAQLVNTLMDFIYKKANQDLADKFEAVVERNSYLDPDGTRAFRYKGELYLTKNYYYPTTRVKTLHKSLYTTMDQIIKDDREISKEQLVVKNYLTCVLVKSKNSADLKALLPDFLHPAIKDLNGLGIEPTVTKDEVESFNKASHFFIDSIKQRLLLNLIT